MAVSGLDDDELNTMIGNYERLKRTEDAKYKELLQERANRMSKAQKLDHLATIALPRQAAAERNSLPTERWQLQAMFHGQLPVTG